MRDILKERAVMQWKLKIDLDEFFNEFNHVDYTEIINRLHMKRAEKKGLTLWGDKTPTYTLDFDIIYKLFPESPYIYIVRDGRDVALSFIRSPYGDHNVYCCAEFWKRINATDHILEKIKEKNRLFFLRYEELLENADTIVPELYEFLSEPYDDKEMSKLLSKIRKNNYNKWQREMSRRQVKVFEKIASNTLRKYGYETTYEEGNIDKISKLFYKLHNITKTCIRLFELNVIDTIKIHFFGKEPFAG